MGKQLDLFLDSGAFTAKTKGVKIDIDAYIDFIKENEEYINVYSNLDSIGDAKQSLKNQEYMEKRGLKPLPIFHLNEDPKYLDFYIKNYDYIALGGIALTKLKQKEKWVHETWRDYLFNEDGTAKVKVHGFGMTQFNLIKKYPWFSVDSSSWLKYGVFGHICIPQKIQGIYRYDKRPQIITVSNKSSNRKVFNKHITTINFLKREVILDFIKKEGFTIEDLAENRISRLLFNGTYFLQSEKQLGVNFYLAGSQTGGSQNRKLEKGLVSKNIRRRILSYYDFKTKGLKEFF